PMSLKRRVLSAGAWSLTDHVFNLSVRLGTNLIMTRLLVPDIFGIMAISNLIMVGLEMLSDFGLKQSIVQSKRGNEPIFLNTAWVVQIFRSVLLWFIALILALFISVADHLKFFPSESVYSDPRLPYVIAAMSITIVIAGFNSTKLYEAARNLTLSRITLVDIISQISGVFCMLGWAFWDRSIWALVAGNISWSLILLFLSHSLLFGNDNRFKWDRSAFREIFHFGKWIFMSSILGFLAMNGDRLLLGSMVDTAMLGIYVIAFNIFSAVEQLLTRIIAGVTFPALSEIVRERPAKLKANYYRVHAIIAGIAYFCSGILMASGNELIKLLYDPRYAQAGWMLEVLAIALLAAPFQISIQFFMALGMPRIQSIISAIRLATLFAAMPIGFHYFGLLGALCGLVLSQLLYLPVLILFSLRHGLLNFQRELFFLPFVLVGLGAGK